MDIKEIKEQTVAQLSHTLEESRKKLDDLLFKAAQKQLKSVRDIRVVKKDIARIMMVLKDKNEDKNTESNKK